MVRSDCVHSAFGPSSAPSQLQPHTFGLRSRSNCLGLRIRLRLWLANSAPLHQRTSRQAAHNRVDGRCPRLQPPCRWTPEVDTCRVLSRRHVRLAQGPFWRFDHPTTGTGRGRRAEHGAPSNRLIDAHSALVSTSRLPLRRGPVPHVPPCT